MPPSLPPSLPRSLAQLFSAASLPVAPPLDASAVAAAARDLPTRSLPSVVSRLLSGRQTTSTIIPAGYGSLYNSPDPGTVVGIVLGSVGGFLLVLWLIYTIVNFGQPPEIAESSYGTASVITLARRSRHHHHHHPRGHKSPVRLRATETVEVRARERESGSGVRPVIVDAAPGMERVRVVEERRTTSRPPPRPVVEDSDDEVVVIEDSTPPRRRRSSARRSSDHRRESYREVDVERRTSRRRS